MMFKILLLVILFIALRAFRPARAELAPPGKVTIYTRPDHWLYPLERHDRARFDIPYAGEASTPEQILHIVYPETGEGPFPLVIFIHGGGWSLFNSKYHEILYTGEMPLNALERGYAVAYVDYRLTNTRIMPEQLYDVKAAVRFLRANAQEYALEADQIVLSGDSAGAHLAALAALTADEEAFEDPERLYPETSCAVEAVISWFGITDFSGDLSELLGWFFGLDSASLTVEDIESLSRMCSPVHNVSPGKAPPFYLQHGLIDSETPYTQSCDLYNELMMKSPNPHHKLELFPGMDHAVTGFMTRENMENILNWMDEVLGRKPI